MGRLVKFKYTNTNGDSIVISHVAPFVYKSISGLGQAENELSSIKQYGVDGATKTTSSLAVRDMEIEMMIAADNFADLQDLKRNAIHVLNPKVAGTLTYTVAGKSYEIDVELIKGIDEGDANTALTQSTVLQFQALDPYWRDVSYYDRLVSLSTADNRFKFPLQITDAYIFSTVLTGQIVQVENAGDAVVGGEFTFTFTRTVVNPRIYNIKTTEFMEFNRTFVAGEKLVVVTTRNKKKMTLYDIDGEEVNAMQFRVVGSTFLQLDNTQTNYLQAQAQSGIEGMFVTLKFVPLKLGV